MSDMESKSPDQPAQPSQPEGAPTLSAGAMLRQAREASGLHIAALAVALKVPVKKLEALESDRFDLLPDVVFVRALAASVCRNLRIDAAPIMERLPHSMTPRLKSVEQGSDVSFSWRGSYGGLPLLNQLSKPLVIFLALLLLGIALLFTLPSKQTAPTTKATPAEPLYETPANLPAALGASQPVLPAPAVSGTPALEAMSGAPAALGSVAASGAAGGAVNASAIVLGSGLSTGLVVIKATAPTWVEVVDARGVVQVRKTLVTGEVLGASGNLPLSVVIGRADAAQVQVRGQALDLKALAKENVARFEVK